MFYNSFSLFYVVDKHDLLVYVCHEQRIIIYVYGIVFNAFSVAALFSYSKYSYDNGKKRNVSTTDVTWNQSPSLWIDNLKFINDTNNNKILLTRNAKVKIFSNNEEKFSLSIPFGSRIYFNNNDKVETKQLLAEWDPYTLPIIAEKAGYI